MGNIKETFDLPQGATVGVMYNGKIYLGVVMPVFWRGNNKQVLVNFTAEGMRFEQQAYSRKTGKKYRGANLEKLRISYLTKEIA